MIDRAWFRPSRRSAAKGHLLDSIGPSGPSPALAEDRQIDLNAIVEQYRGVLLGGLSVVVLLLLLLDLIQARRIRRLGRRLDGLTRGTDEQSLESILSTHLDKVYAVGRELDQLSARSAVLEADSRKAIQRVGLVRFNPFEDTGGNQSFAMALTDAAGDGFVVSSLHSRTGTRVYAKAITGGRSDGALSAEEAEALRLAMASGPRADRTGRAGAV